METSALRQIGLSENEIKIYLLLLKTGSTTAYDISRRTGIYRVHIYDKLEQLMKKGLVTHVYMGSKKHFQATHPSKLKQYLEDRKKDIELHEEALDKLLPELEAMTKLPHEDTRVEVFKGLEGIKYFLKDIIKSRVKYVLITGIDDAKYMQHLPIFVKQHFRNLKNSGIRERVITLKRPGIFTFDKKTAPTTTYRFLEAAQFNPTNTFIYGNKVVIVSWGTPPSAIMIQNKELADTYRSHFSHLWKIASRTNA